MNSPVKLLISFLLLGLLSQLNFAASGQLFNVNSSGVPANIDITVCLNAKGLISCQNFNIDGLTLSINTNIPNRSYHFAGIKVNTPGYQIKNCMQSINGYCVFNASSNSSSILIGTIEQNYAYIVNFNSGKILLCKVNSNNGNLESCSETGPTINQAVGIALNSQKTKAYITSYNTRVINVCSINPVTKMLSNNCSSSSSPIFTNQQLGIAVHPEGDAIYIVRQNISQIIYCKLENDTTIDSCQITGSGISSPWDVTLNSAGTNAYVTNFLGSVLTCSIDPLTKAFSSCTPTSISVNPVGLAINDNFAYVQDYSGNNEFYKCSFNSNTRVLENCNIAGTGPITPYFSSIDPNNNFLYISSYASNTIKICNLAPGTGNVGICNDSDIADLNGPDGIVIF